MSELDLVERRLEQLETLILGIDGKDAFRSREINAIDTASACSDTLKSATKGHARIKDTYANLSQLKSALDPVVADKRIEAEDLQMGMNLVLSDEERIRDISAKLEQVQTLNAVAMDSEPIHNVPKMTERLNKLVELTIDQQGDAQLATKETEELLLRYNDIVNSLTRQFVSWDVIVTKLEMAAQTKEDDYL